MALLKEFVDTTLSFHVEMFPTISFSGDNEHSTLSYFTAQERDLIKSKIREYENNHKSRSGGSELLGCLSRIQTAKESLERNIEQIRSVLSPKVVTRTTLAEATMLAEQASIRRIAASFSALPEKMLRGLAESVVGDIQLEYTAEELPILIATKQISNIVLDPGKVL